MTDTSTPSVLAAGYAPLDIVQYRGRTWHAAGGTAGNVAAILGFMGWRSTLAVDVGNDRAGEEIRRDLRKANVNIDLIRLSSEVRTPRLVHEIDGQGHRYRYRCPDCAQKFPMSRPLRKDRAEQLVNECEPPDVFFFDRLNAGTLVLAERFREMGSFIVFEPSRPARPEFTKRAINVAHVVKHSDDRTTGLAEAEPSKSQLWVVTGGVDGAKFRYGNTKWRQSAAFRYPVVDAGGAGDWTTAGLIHTLPRSERRTLQAIEDSLRWAQALAAVSCGAPGARGLARKQSASAVVSAASFLHKGGDGWDSPEPTKSLRKRRAPTSGCPTCLQDPSEPSPQTTSTQRLKTG